MSDKLVHRELSYLINGCIFDVHNEIGPGVREECYQKAMELRLAEVGIPCVAKPATRRDLVYRGELIDTFVPDLVVLDQIILELKAKRDGLCGQNFAQLLSYVKFWNVQLGILINFAQSQAIIERLPYISHPVAPIEDYDWIREEITADLRPTLLDVRESLLNIQSTFGCGYCDTTYRDLVSLEFRHHGLTCQSIAIVRPTFHERHRPTSTITPMLINGLILVEIQAVHDDISATAVRTMQTHLRLSGCRVGLIVSFGKTRFSIRGVRPYLAQEKERITTNQERRRIRREASLKFNRTNTCARMTLASGCQC